MTALEALIQEFEHEIKTTRKMLTVVPADKFDWSPHEKSMKLGSLANHIAELPSWFGYVLNTDEMDFATQPYTPKVFTSTADLLAFFETTAAEGLQELQGGKAVDLQKIWPIRNGETILAQDTKQEALRHTMSQMIHHRAQLGVFLRLLNIPLPGSYGPSADSTF